ncbi:hypothetical protein H257_17393 [Aphanomyces astaci]|uniref:No apical meristem-associated C-terminal domain-containing protein n=1 Tax=Aphanomyces astaci TaxID=112090 RepID=W4FGU2_APHAT|nr:hypothetical protein H257_17393 [Aphanomyces astaci]ETV66064.1 hypothetical protein H257_17393 [Aphanomyces astaci]|eukprot:XP_009844493.1 hypothetical protein H257_17393 [Aphanomyces astaci]
MELLLASPAPTEANLTAPQRTSIFRSGDLQKGSGIYRRCAQEAVQLARSWLAISSDSATGAAQKAADLNKRVYDHWLLHKASNDHGDRTPHAIVSRCKNMPHALQLQRFRCPSAQENPIGLERRWCHRYRAGAIHVAKLHGIDRLTILACWRIVQDGPTWRVEVVESVYGKRSADDLQRPTGMKAAKASNKATRYSQVELHARFVKAAEAKTTHMAKRHQLSELKFMFQVFGQDPPSEEDLQFNRELRSSLLLRARQLQSATVTGVARSLVAEDLVQDDVDEIDNEV